MGQSFLPSRSIGRRNQRKEISRRELFRKLRAEIRRTILSRERRARETSEKREGRYELYVIRFLQRHGNLEDPATTLPTCCPRYPPGSTLLECRLEGDQPVAHVVQIPDERSAATQKTCLLVETKASKSGPSAR